MERKRVQAKCIWKMAISTKASIKMTSDMGLECTSILALGNSTKVNGRIT